MKASPSWMYVELIIDTNIGWELYEKGEYLKTINHWREWRNKAGTDGKYEPPYVFLELLRPKLSYSGNEALSQAIAVLKASCNW